MCPGDVCFEPAQAGPCDSGAAPAAERWYFNPERNACQRVPAGQCGAQHNMFESKEMCDRVCPGQYVTRNTRCNLQLQQPMCPNPAQKNQNPDSGATQPRNKG